MHAMHMPYMCHAYACICHACHTCAYVTHMSCICHAYVIHVPCMCHARAMHVHDTHAWLIFRLPILELAQMHSSAPPSSTQQTGEEGGECLRSGHLTQLGWIAASCCDVERFSFVNVPSPPHLYIDHVPICQTAKTKYWIKSRHSHVISWQVISWHIISRIVARR